VRGSCGEKVVHYTEVEESPVPEDMAKGTYIRWLVSKEDGAPTFYMRLFRTEKDAHIKAHYHPWEHEIFVLSGKLEVRIGSKTYHVQEGTVIYIPPNVEHEYWSLEESSFLCIIPARPSAEKTEEPIKC
jgi:quercetin dioxygenase-like cupin family protein